VVLEKDTLDIWVNGTKVAIGYFIIIYRVVLEKDTLDIWVNGTKVFLRYFI
jgi:Fe2+ transport system protein FeoA